LNVPPGTAANAQQSPFAEGPQPAASPEQLGPLQVEVVVLHTWVLPHCAAEVHPTQECVEALQCGVVPEQSPSERHCTQVDVEPWSRHRGAAPPQGEHVAPQAPFDLHVVHAPDVQVVLLPQGVSVGG
jgi:hypothetical protein